MYSVGKLFQSKALLMSKTCAISEDKSASPSAQSDQSLHYSYVLSTVSWLSKEG